MSLVGKKAPEFTAEAVQGCSVKKVSLSDYKGKAVLFFFYPFDFTFVCPTELHAFSDTMDEFNKRGVELLACSVDSVYSHIAWLGTPRSHGGIEHVAYPIVSDITKNIARDYGVLIEDEGFAVRGSFLIDEEGIVQMEQVYAAPFGRSVEEALRVVDMWQFYKKHGEVCPVNWKAGDKSMVASKEGAKEYFGSSYK